MRLSLFFYTARRDRRRAGNDDSTNILYPKEKRSEGRKKVLLRDQPGLKHGTWHTELMQACRSSSCHGRRGVEQQEAHEVNVSLRCRVQCSIRTGPWRELRLSRPVFGGDGGLKKAIYLTNGRGAPCRCGRGQTNAHG